MKIFLYLFVPLLFGIVGSLLIPKLIHLLKAERNFLMTNYEGKKIPVCGFVIHVISFIGFAAAVTFLYLLRIDLNSLATLPLMSMIIGALTSTVAGLIDDLVNVPEKGFKGHLRAFFEGKVTPGIIKIFLIVSASFIFSITIAKSFVDVIVSVILISLTANFVNLLDLRPGRAIKVHLIFLFATLIFAFFKLEYEMVLPVSFYWFTCLAPLLIFLMMDLKKKVILGDSGSNALGFLLGATWVYMLENLYLKLSLLIFMLLINIYAEFGSITELIEKNSFLKRLDEMGRSGK